MMKMSQTPNGILNTCALLVDLRQRDRRNVLASQTYQLCILPQTIVIVTETTIH